jgi:hypothetical protein
VYSASNTESEGGTLLEHNSDLDRMEEEERMTRQNKKKRET